MPRFLSREEWPLVAAGIIAGLLTSALIVYLFITGLGGSPPEPVQDALREAERVPRADPQPPSDTAASRGVIGQRLTGVERRLAGMAVPTRRIRTALTVTVRDGVWADPTGRRFARVDEGTARLEVAALGRGDIVLTGVVLRRPVVDLYEDTRGGWNYEAVFADLLEPDVPRPPGAPRRVVQFRDVEIVNGTVNVQRPADRFAFQAVAGRLPVVSLSQPGIADPFVRAAGVSARFVRGDAELAVAVEDGLFQLPEGRVRFDVAAATIDGTRLTSVRGEWNPAEPGYGVTATGVATGVQFEDFRVFAPDVVPETGTATFAFAVRPAAPDATEISLTELDATADGSRVRGAVGFLFGPAGFALQDADLRLDPVQLALVERFTGPLPWGGSLTGRLVGTGGDIRFDLAASLTADAVPDGFVAQLGGRVRVTADGVVLQTADIDLDRVPLAALRAVAPGLPLDGAVTGRVSLRGAPGVAPLDVDVRLELGAGVALVQGTLDLTGEEMQYDLDGRLVGVDLQAVFRPAVPPVTLTASFTLSGAGTDPAAMTADLWLAGGFTGWETTPRDTIRLDVRIRNGVAHVDDLVARLATAELGARGEWRFLEPSSGAITYALDVGSLRPFGPFIPFIGDPVAAGRFRANGGVAGSLDRPRLEGVMEGANLRVGEWQASSLTTTYEVELGDPVPRAVVAFSGRGLVTPTAGSFSAAVLDLRLEPPFLELDLAADRPDVGRVELRARGDVPQEGPRTIVLEEAAADIEDGRWELVAPATIVWTDGGVVVENLELIEAGSDGRFNLAGRVLPLTEADVRLGVAGLPMAEVQRLLGRDPIVAGTLSADGVVAGGSSPRIDIEFRVDQGEVEQVPLRRFDGRITYADGLATATARIETDTVGALEVEASIPALLRLDEDPAFELVDGMAVEGTLTARRFSLVPFRSAFPEVRELRGLVDGEATLTGTTDQPRLEGALTLSDGHVRIPAFNQRYTEISGRASFVDRNIVVEDARARSDGWAVASGNVVLERLDRPVLDITVELRGFRPVGVVDQQEAAMEGRLTLAGPPEALVLTGRVAVGDGDVVVPDFGGGIDPDLIDITRPAPVLGEAPPAEADAWLRNLRVDNLVVDFAADTWFQLPPARAQLGGQLTINKMGDDTPIVGTLTGSRGQYTLVAGPIVRRFQIVAAQVRFLGSPTPDPAIDFTVRRVIIDAAGRPVDVDVRIAGTVSSPTLAVGSAELAALPESELLSFLLFGQPSFAVGGDFLPGDRLVEQTFLGGFAEIAAFELERTFAGLGFDIFQIRLGAGRLGGIGSPTFVVGRELAPDVFLTLETGMMALFGGPGGETPLNTWAARLDWNFDRRSRARLALEPVYRGRSLRGPGLALPLTDPQQQLLLELRRRWTW